MLLPEANGRHSKTLLYTAFKNDSTAKLCMAPMGAIYKLVLTLYLTRRERDKARVK